MRRLVLVLLAGCGGGHALPDALPDAAPDAAPPPTGYLPVMSVPVVTLPDLDMLFVVEDGPNMAANQQHLGAAIATLTDSFDTLRGGRPDLHIGVASSDSARPARTATRPPRRSARAAAPASSVRSSPPRRTPARSSAMRTARSATRAPCPTCSARCCSSARPAAIFQPFAAMALALATPGFVRPGENLLFAIVGDADDCSATDPALLHGSDARPADQLPLLRRRA